MNVDAMIKHHQAVTEVITHAMSDYASAATGTSWNKACFAFEADAILCALSRAGFRILGPDEVDPVTMTICPDCDGQKLMHGYDCDCPRCAATGVVPLGIAIRSILDDDDADVFEKLDDIRRALGRKA